MKILIFWWSLSSQIFLTLKQKNHMSWPFCPYYIQYDPNIEKSALLSCCCCYFTQCKKNWCIFFEPLIPFFLWPIIFFQDYSMSCDGIPRVMVYKREAFFLYYPHASDDWINLGLCAADDLSFCWVIKKGHKEKICRLHL